MPSLRPLVRFALLSIALIAACGPSAGGADDVVDGGDTGIACTGNETRCVGTQYQVCDGDTFQVGANCPYACDASRGGCVECTPGMNACMGNTVMTCDADGTFGTPVEMCDDGTECSGGVCTRACSADGVDIIYVVDDAYNLVAFDPRLIGQTPGPYRLIGRLNCPNPGTSLQLGGGTATPFSMAVDRNAVAWVLYSSGKLFRVSTADASCQATTFVPQQTAGPQTWNLFGMGYVTDTAGGDTEKLWIGGGEIDAMNESGSLGWIDTTTYAVNYVNAIGPTAMNSAEFTGLGDATLWAFFPDTTNNAFVQQIDKATGMGVGQQMAFDLAASGRTVRAWAFAQWGGTFYVFVTTVDFLGGNANAAVHAVNRSTGAHTIPLQNQQYIVVGAGVSTCAPIVIGGPPI